MQMRGVDMGRMLATAGTWQADPRDAKGLPVWGPRALYGHTVLRTLLHLTCVLPELQQTGKRKLSGCLEPCIVFSPAAGPL